MPKIKVPNGNPITPLEIEKIEVPNPRNKDVMIENLFMLYEDTDGDYKLFMQSDEHSKDTEMLFTGLSAIAGILSEQTHFPMAEGLGIKVIDAINAYAMTLQGFEEHLKENENRDGSAS